jgi:hypothetical protein
MSGYQEDWVEGKVISRITSIRPLRSFVHPAKRGKKRKTWESPGRGLVYDCSLRIVFSDGSNLFLLADRDDVGPLIEPTYQPAFGGE